MEKKGDSEELKETEKRKFPKEGGRARVDRATRKVGGKKRGGRFMEREVCSVLCFSESGRSCGVTTGLGGK